MIPSYRAPGSQQKRRAADIKKCAANLLERKSLGALLELPRGVFLSEPEETPKVQVCDLDQPEETPHVRHVFFNPVFF